MVKIKNAHRSTIYEYNFQDDYTIYICAYDNLLKIDPKYNKRPKTGQKGSKIGQKMVKIKNAHRNTIYECNFLHDYTIYICTYDTIQKIDPKYNKGPKRVQNR